MKIIFFILTLFVALFAMPVNKHTIMDISRTYGYYQGQLYTLNKIKKKHPKLSDEVYITKIDFDLSFSESIKNIDVIMGKYDWWESVKKDITKKTHSYIDSSSLTYNEAVDFIKAVKKRTKGDIESPVLETLLMLNPEYEKHPEQEFYDGFKKKYKCDDFKKSKGVDFTIEVPMSWKSKKANRPNIVRKFGSQNGYSLEIIMVLVYNFPEVKYLSDNVIKSMLNKKQMEEALPSNAILKDYGFIKLETMPCYWQRYSVITQKVRKQIFMEVLGYTIFYKDKLIQIQFQVRGLNNKNLEKRFKKFEPLFDSIINSFVLTGLYK